MKQVRDELGDDAVIVSTHGGRKGEKVRITAAIEPPDLASAAYPPASERAGRRFAVLEEALAGHGVPKILRRRLLYPLADLKVEDPVMALGCALDSRFRFAPLADEDARRPLILIGPPGVGKTVSLAKLAAQRILDGQPVTVLTTDTIRAGAIEQIKAYTRALGLNVQVCEDAAALGDAVANLSPNHLALIDSPGANSFHREEMRHIGGLIEAARAQAVLVLAAGGDAAEAGEIGTAFAALGATRLLATRLDTSRRLGGLLTAANTGDLRFCGVGYGPEIASGIYSLNPVSLARMLLPKTVTESVSLGKESHASVRPRSLARAAS
jgi:flagellar biosynthesis protein FlhF